jgi:hypothetical protein
VLAEEQMLPEVALPVAPEAVEQDVQAEPEVVQKEGQAEPEVVQKEVRAEQAEPEVAQKEMRAGEQAEPEVELPEEQLVVVVRLLAWARCPA